MGADDLRGARGVITGAGSGVGRALAVGLSHQGVELALIGRRAATLEKTASLLPQATHSVIVTGDLSIPDEVEAVCTHVRDAFPGTYPQSNALTHIIMIPSCKKPSQ